MKMLVTTYVNDSFDERLENQTLVFPLPNGIDKMLFKNISCIMLILNDKRILSYKAKFIDFGDEQEKVSNNLKKKAVRYQLKNKCTDSKSLFSNKDNEVFFLSSSIFGKVKKTINGFENLLPKISGIARFAEPNGAARYNMQTEIDLFDFFNVSVADVSKTSLLSDVNEEFSVDSQNFPKKGTKNKLHVLSLFSGCGGMDIGFEGEFTCLKRSVNEKIHPDWIAKSDETWVDLVPTGFQTVFANDIRPDAKAEWNSYFSQKRKKAGNVYHLESIVELVKKAKESQENVFPDDVDIVTGGFPCQDFSLAGKRLGFASQKSHDGTALKPDEPSEESRGKLYMWMREVITLTKPKIFIAENVKGLTNLSNVKTIIEHDFSDAADGGYIVLPAQVLHAADYGVPQSRERVIFFGFKKSALKPGVAEILQKDIVPEEFNPYPPKTHAFTIPKTDELSAPVTCEEAFTGLAEPEYSRDKAQAVFGKAKYMGRHCQGQTEIKMNSIGPTIRSEHHGNIEFRRLSEEHGGTHKEELMSGLQERRLTVRECARIQTFPDNYDFIIPAMDGNPAVASSHAYVVIGNAVPCVLAYNIAMNLKKKWHLYFD